MMLAVHIAYKLVLAELLRRFEIAGVEESIYLLDKLKKHLEDNEVIKTPPDK